MSRDLVFDPPRRRIAAHLAHKPFLPRKGVPHLATSAFIVSMLLGSI
jgi:hypothetical protein